MIVLDSLHQFPTAKQAGRFFIFLVALKNSKQVIEHSLHNTARGSFL